MFETMSECPLKKIYQHPCKYHKNKSAKDQADGKCSRTCPLPPTQAVRELENEVFLFVSLYEAEVKYAILVEE